MYFFFFKLQRLKILLCIQESQINNAPLNQESNPLTDQKKKESNPLNNATLNQESNPLNSVFLKIFLLGKILCVFSIILVMNK